MLLQHLDGRTILLVEDNDSHAVLISRMLSREQPDKNLKRAKNGREALDLLFSADSTLISDIFAIILDLHMPEISGYEVLRMVRLDRRTNRVPVIVLSTNTNQLELERCLIMGADLTLTKAGDHKTFAQTVRKIVIYLRKLEQNRPVA